MLILNFDSSELSPMPESMTDNLISIFFNAIIGTQMLTNVRSLDGTCGYNDLARGCAIVEFAYDSGRFNNE